MPIDVGSLVIDGSYRFRGSIKPTAEVKRPVKAYRNADTADANGSKSTSATIDIFDVIDSWGGYWGISAAEVDQALAELGDSVTTLYVRVNSPGGEATEGIAIANLLRAHAATIHVTNYGLAASAASIISIAGDTLSMAPGSLLMIHKAWNIVRGNADDLKSEAGILDKFDQSLASLYTLKAGSDTDWLALMGAETWFTPEDAVKAGLADTVGIETGPPPVNPDDQAEPLPDGDSAPFDRAAQVFDLSVFRNTPAAFAAHTLPAEPPEKPPTNEEADTMSDTLIKALRERLSLGDDADEAAVLAKADELLEQATKPGEPTAEVEPTDEQIAAYLEKSGKTVVSQVKLEELESMAKDGAEARAQQRETARDEAIEAAFKAGKISAERRDTWRAAWDKDPEGTKSDLDSLQARFPVAAAGGGYQGSDGTDGDATVFTDDEAEALSRVAGVSKEALTNG